MRAYNCYTVIFNFSFNVFGSYRPLQFTVSSRVRFSKLQFFFFWNCPFYPRFIILADDFIKLLTISVGRFSISFLISILFSPSILPKFCVFYSYFERINFWYFLLIVPEMALLEFPTMSNHWLEAAQERDGLAAVHQQMPGLEARGWKSTVFLTVVAFEGRSQWYAP